MFCKYLGVERGGIGRKKTPTKKDNYKKRQLQKKTTTKKKTATKKRELPCSYYLVVRQGTHVHGLLMYTCCSCTQFQSLILDAFVSSFMKCTSCRKHYLEESDKIYHDAIPAVSKLAIEAVKGNSGDGDAGTYIPDDPDTLDGIPPTTILTNKNFPLALWVFHNTVSVRVEAERMARISNSIAPGGTGDESVIMDAQKEGTDVLNKEDRTRGEQLNIEEAELAAGRPRNKKKIDTKSNR